jgi:hypothetical protein
MMSALTRRLARCAVALIVAMATLGSIAHAQAPADEAQVKAAFVFNFLKFIDWPADAFVSPRDSLIVGIVGKTPTAEAVASLLDGKQVNSRALAIRRFGEDESIVGVHAVFIGDSNQTRAQRILDATETATVLSIGEGNGFATRGGTIGLLVEAQRVRFEINTDVAQAARLKISSKLLALAKVVHSRTREQTAP